MYSRDGCFPSVQIKQGLLQCTKRQPSFKINYEQKTEKDNALCVSLFVLFVLVLFASKGPGVVARAQETLCRREGLV